MAKQITTYPLKAYYTVRKEQATNTPDNMGEPQQYYAEWKKPDTAGPIWYDTICMF